MEWKITRDNECRISFLIIILFMEKATNKFSQGVIYFVTKEKQKRSYLDEAIYSASTLKKQSPDIHITLFTDFYIDYKNNMPFNNTKLIQSKKTRIKLK